MSHSVCFEYLLHVWFWMHQNERKLSRKLTTDGAKEQLNLLVVRLYDEYIYRRLVIWTFY